MAQRSLLHGSAAHGWTAQEATARRALRLLVGIFTALIWIDNLSEHYRGAFKIKTMWIPVLVDPVVAVVSVVSALSPRDVWRRWLLALSALQGVIALVGLVYHQRGIVRRVGRGWRMYLFHAWYGPPIVAPLQYLGFCVLGLLATLPHRTLAPLLQVIALPRLLRLFVAVNAPPLWVEIAYLHWRGSFQSRWQWLPVVTVPIVGAASAVATVWDHKRVQVVHQVMAGWMIALGALGTGFHLWGLRRQYHGFDPKALLFNWLSGPPALAPLQMIALGLATLIGEWATEKRT